MEPLTHLLRAGATPQQMEEMLRALGTYIKVAVLLDAGSRQEDVWGADWVPSLREVRFEALINISPRRKNRSMTIGDPAVRERVAEIVRQLLEAP